MKDKILVLGKGYIGERLARELGCQVSDRKIYAFSDAEDEIKKFNPDIIINCIGHTGKNVDDCELDKNRTLTANTFSPLILAEAIIHNNEDNSTGNKIRLIHISSGCIYHYDYSKDKPIDESAVPDFFDLFYSRSKIYSEQPLNILAKRYPILIIRIRVPLDDRPHPKNLLTKLISYKKVIDVPNSVTYLPDFVKALKHLMKIEAIGIYNVVNRGGLRYPQLLDTYRKYAPDFKYEIIGLKKLNLIRTNLVMSTKKLEDSGFKVRGVDEVLEECVQNYIKY